MTTRISVAMATFNGARFLREQLDSLARQQVLPHELVVSDDGSSDETLAVLRAFERTSPFPIRVDAHPETLGVTENFFRAIRQCSGDVVALCDQDDTWEPTKLALGVSVFADPGVMALAHRCRVVHEDLSPTPLLLPDLPRARDVTVFNLDPLFNVGGMQFLFRRAPLVPWLQLPLPESKWWPAPAVFDEFLFFLASSCGRVALRPDILTLWRRRQEGFTTSESGPGRTVFNSAKLQAELRWSVGAAEYARMADMAATRSTFLERMERSRDSGGTPPLSGAAAHYRRYEATWRFRASLYEAARPSLRFARLAKMVARADYRPRTAGGLGLKSLAKDSLQALRALHSQA